MASMTMGQGHARGALLPVQSGQSALTSEGLRSPTHGLSKAVRRATPTATRLRENGFSRFNIKLTTGVVEN